MRQLPLFQTRDLKVRITCAYLDQPVKHVVIDPAKF